MHEDKDVDVSGCPQALQSMAGKGGGRSDSRERAPGGQLETTTTAVQTGPRVIARVMGLRAMGGSKTMSSHHEGRDCLNKVSTVPKNYGATLHCERSRGTALEAKGTASEIAPEGMNRNPTRTSETPAADLPEQPVCRCSPGLEVKRPVRPGPREHHLARPVRRERPLKKERLRTGGTAPSALAPRPCRAPGR